jgi:SAM-dependent methyltransferase
VKVLDVGSGTGFVVQQWQELGVQHLVGSDISPFVVKQLSALYPCYRFVELDFRSPRVCDALPGNSFDCVSALMSCTTS